MYRLVKMRLINYRVYTWVIIAIVLQEFSSTNVSAKKPFGIVVVVHLELAKFFYSFRALCIRLQIAFG